MNPYLEQTTVWHDFHKQFCPSAAESITSQVRPHYIVKIAEHVFIHELCADARNLIGRGDVASAQRPQPFPSVAASVATAPTQVRLPTIDSERLSFIEIRDRQSLRVVTVIELLSPANKLAGPDRESYLSKRNEILSSGVHLVEIDLLRGHGARLPMIDLPACDYYVMVSRSEDRPHAGVWPIQLEDRLPVIPIPLSSPQESAELDLQSILHRIYDAAGYEDYIYRGEPEPALKDVAWSRQFLPTEFTA
jgi:hypothetical protein